MTKAEVYQAALSMSPEEQAKFKAFLRSLLESEDTVIPPASDQKGSV